MTDANSAPTTAADVPTRRRSVPAVLVALPLGLAIIAEAAWISVVAGLVQEFALQEPHLGIASFAAFVVAGVLAARLVGVRLGKDWPLAAAGICLAGGAIGWLSAPEVQALLRVGAVGEALATNPAGWLAALAIARGFAHARVPLREATLAHLLAAGIPGLAVAAIIGGVVADPFRSRFLADAIVASIVFATCATLSLALTRLTAVGADSGFDWRQNPSWVGLVTVIVVATAALAIASSPVAASAIEVIVLIAIEPLLLLGLVAGLFGGFDRRAFRVLAFSILAVFAIAGLFSLLGSRDVVRDLGPGAGLEVPASPSVELMAVGGVLLLVVAAIAIVLMARLWMRRTVLIEDDVFETRMIDRGGNASRGSRRRVRLWGHGRADPVDAVTAYLALVDDLADRPEVRREPAETPAEHARRLRDTGGSVLGLDLLAADYALARFAGIRLSKREDRRAIARWRALRRQLGGPDRRRRA
jgi:hypothetical protein